MAAPVLQFKRGAYSSLPALKPGEPAFTTDLFDLYVGLDTSTSNNKFFGSHRYWTREGTTTGSGINLVEGTDNGSDYVTLSAPASVGAAVTYYFPATQGSSSSVLTNDGSGNLTWSSGSNNATFTGITTFSDTTDNTLGDSNTGSVLFDGGVGIDKNLTVGANLNVQGYSEFVGVVTFKGGTINLGDENTDDINVAGEFVSDLIPNTDDTYNLGSDSKQWKNLYLNGQADIDSLNVSGISTFNDTVTFAGVGTNTYILEDILTRNIDASGVTTFRSSLTVSSGDITLNSGALYVSSLSPNRVALVGSSSSLSDSANLTFTDDSGLIVSSSGINVTGLSTFSADLHLGGDIKVGGDSILASDGLANISLDGNSLTQFAGDIRVDGGNIQDQEGNNAITFEGSSNIKVEGDLTVGGNDIKASDGASSITLSASTGNVGIASDLTVTGNLYVNGSTTQVNTTQLTVEDTLIELGRVDGNDPSSDVNKDIGFLLNYYTNAAKKAAVYWDDSTQRISISSDVSESASVLTSNAYAALEIGSLWINDCAGQSQVINCSGSTRTLENITIDGGSF